MRRLLYIITLAELGGAQSHVAELLRGFHGRYELHLASSVEGPLIAFARDLGVYVHLLPGLQRTINPLNDVRAVHECVDLLRRIQPDIVHLHSSKAGFIGRIATHIAKIPVVFTAHGWGFKPGVPPSRRIVVWSSERVVSGFTNKIICVSDYDRNLALRYKISNPKQLITIHNGLSHDAPQASPSKGEELSVIMTARFQEPKEQQLLLRAFAQCKASNIRLLFVGDGPQINDSKALSARLDLENRVSFLGDRDDVPTLLAHAHVFVLLSRYEGLPISILEAMRANLPVIASRVGGVPELVRHGASGYLVPPGDARAVAGGIITLASSPALRVSMGAKGRQIFEAKFTQDQMLARIEAVYQTLLSE